MAGRHIPERRAVKRERIFLQRRRSGHRGTFLRHAMDVGFSPWHEAQKLASVNRLLSHHRIGSLVHHHISRRTGQLSRGRRSTRLHAHGCGLTPGAWFQLISAEWLSCSGCRARCRPASTPHDLTLPHRTTSVMASPADFVGLRKSEQTVTHGSAIPHLFLAP
jgi:hypothetical protein